jgi:hypothetical protein
MKGLIQLGLIQLGLIQLGLIQLERLVVFRSEAWFNMAIHTLALSSIWRSQALHGEENGTWMETFWVGNCLELVRSDRMIEPCTCDHAPNSDQNLDQRF